MIVLQADWHYVLLLWLPCLVWLGPYIAEQKGRNVWEGALLGLLFGPFGCLIEALLPTLEAWRPEPKGKGKAAAAPQTVERHGHRVAPEQWRGAVTRRAS